MSTKEKDLLALGCLELELNLTNHQIDSLLNYVELLIKWNKVYNITSIKNRKDIVIKHILDSLSIIKHIRNYISSCCVDKIKLIDVGTGGGLPGIIIAITNPDIHISLLDSNSKKTSFLKQAIIQLDIKNVNVINKRTNEYTPEISYDVIVSRAFASLADYVNLTKHLLSSNGIIFAMKGKLQSFESLEFNKSCESFGIIDSFKLKVPFLTDDRCLIKLKRKNK